MDLEKLNKQEIDDPLTGRKQTVYWNDDGTFFMSIPDRVSPLKCTLPKVIYTKNEDGSTTWNIVE